MNVLTPCLDAIEIGSPKSHAGLTMFPLLRPQTPESAYLLLDEALESGFAEITEVSASGSVPELLFRNKGDRDILLTDGEELVGAKQNRVLNLSILVGAGQQIKIPVSCVEQGRWSWRSDRFQSGKRKLHAKARSEKLRRVSDLMASSGRRASPEIQSSVWRSVDEKMSALNCHSETAALHDVYAQSDNLIGAVRDAFSSQEGQIGAVFAIGDRIVGMDLYDSHATLKKLLPKLVDSYAIDAIEESGAPGLLVPSLEQVREMLQRLASAQTSRYPAVAKGDDIRIEASALHGAALVDQGRIAHLAAFHVM